MKHDIVWTTQFKKNYKLALKRHLDIDLLDNIIKQHFALAKLHFYVDYAVWFFVGKHYHCLKIINHSHYTSNSVYFSFDENSHSLNNP